MGVNVKNNGTLVLISAAVVFFIFGRRQQSATTADGSITYTHDPITYNYGDPGYTMSAPTQATDQNVNQIGTVTLNHDGSVTYNC